MRIRVVFLLDCPLILSLFKHKDVGVFLKKKRKKNSNRRSPLNSSIDILFLP